MNKLFGIIADGWKTLTSNWGNITLVDGLKFLALIVIILIVARFVASLLMPVIVIIAVAFLGKKLYDLLNNKDGGSGKQ